VRQPDWCCRPWLLRLLAALVPPPGVHLARCFGVLASNARLCRSWSPSLTPSAARGQATCQGSLGALSTLASAVCRVIHLRLRLYLVEAL